MKNLDPEFYTDPALYERERQLIFWNTWQLLGPLSYLALPGDYLATEIAGAQVCLLYTSPSPRDATLSRMPSSA